MIVHVYKCREAVPIRLYAVDYPKRIGEDQEEAFFL